jgi:REP element-mobilizing transposase RayT
MPRSARFKVEGADAWYHIYSKVRGPEKYYPLAERELQRKLINLLQRFTLAYCCRLISYCVMGNHWHAIVHFESPRPMDNLELIERARMLYPGKSGEKILSLWGEEEWQRFEKRLFDLSELMRNVNAAFTRWYNRIHKTVGGFWADRFKSVALADERAVLDCMLYVELNPVRAGLVEHPEDFEGSSAFLRRIGRGDSLVSLSEIMGIGEKRKAAREYRSLLYYRGNVPTREGQAKIPDRVVREEESRGFKKRGAFLKRLRYMRDGVVLGTKEQVREQLAQLRRKGRYLRRRHPIPQQNGLHYTLREQRSHAVI